MMLPAVHAGSVRASIDLPGEIADSHGERRDHLAQRQRGTHAARDDARSRQGHAGQLVVARDERSGRAPRSPPALRRARPSSPWAKPTSGSRRCSTSRWCRAIAIAPRRAVPAGFELTSVSGPSVEELTVRDGVVSLTVREPARRRHQFLITFERRSERRHRHGRQHVADASAAASARKASHRRAACRCRGSMACSARWAKWLSKASARWSCRGGEGRAPSHRCERAERRRCSRWRGSRCWRRSLSAADAGGGVGGARGDALPGLGGAGGGRGSRGGRRRWSRIRGAR